VEETLRSVLSGRGLPLYRMMAYQLGWQDERGQDIRTGATDRTLGPFAVETAVALGAAEEAALVHAASVELLLSSLQIHEDVADENAERGGRTSVPGVWGMAQAVNAGDGMHAVARLALFDLDDRGASPDEVTACLRVIDEATVQLSEGAYLEVNGRDKSPRDVDAYLEMVSLREGALMGCAARLGALAAGRTAREAEDAMGAFGVAVGVVRWAEGDRALFWPRSAGEGGDPTRFLGRAGISLPVAHALAAGTPGVRRAIAEHRREVRPDVSGIASLARILEESGSRAFVEETVRRFLAEADKALSAAELHENGATRLRSAARAIVRLAGS